MPRKDEVNYLVLPNGVKLVHKKNPESKLSFCSFVFDAGSRDESPDEIGLAHFTEHMLFKGTNKRKPHHIINRLDSVGGDLNAYTTKEKTSYYAVAPKEHFMRSFELLFDLTQNSIFPENEITKEKGVVCEEIEMYNDSPEDLILEEMDKILFPDHSLGTAILGTRDDVLSIFRPKILKFKDQNYIASKTAVGVFGNYNNRSLDRVINQYLVNIPQNNGELKVNRIPPSPIKPFSKTVVKNIQQASAVLSGYSYSYGHDNYFAFQLLVYILGGPPLNSILNIILREKHGLTYNSYAFFNPYMDTGTWGIYIGCDKTNLKKAIDLVYKELNKLRKIPFTQAQLNAWKKQYSGYLLMSFESISAQMLSATKDVLDFQRTYSLEDVLKYVGEIKIDSIYQAANDMFDSEKIFTLIYEPA